MENSSFFFFKCVLFAVWFHQQSYNRLKSLFVVQCLNPDVATDEKHLRNFTLKSSRSIWKRGCDIMALV